MIIATGALERPFPDSRLDAARRDDGRRRADGAEGVGPRADGPHRAGRQRAAALAAGGAAPAGRRHASRRSSTPRRGATGCARCRICRDFALSPYFAKGLTLLREVRAKVPVHRASIALAARGRRTGCARSSSARAAASERMPVDLLLLHQGVVPNVNLAIAAGVAHRWNERQLCFEPVLDADFGSSVPGIAVAGDGAGIAGGTAAAERGRIAGHRRRPRARARRRRCRTRRPSASACSARRWAAPSSTGSTARPMRSACPRATRSSAAARRSPPSRCATRRDSAARARTR